MTQQRLDFPVLARGAYGLAPPGTLNPQAASGPLWRALNNLRPVDGELRHREGLIEGVGPLKDPPWLDDVDQYVQLVVELCSGDARLSDNSRWLVVTSREIWVLNAATWYNMTPRYEVGTVAITNGTAALAGTSTLWQTRRIAPDQEVELPRASGDWYAISSVNSDGSITLATNYTGTTLSGANYSIRRCFTERTAPYRYPVFMEVLNGDIYLAGILAHGEYTPAPAITIADGAVIRLLGVASRVNSTFDPVTQTEYVTSGQTAVVAGLDNLGYLIVPVGFSVLADGRFVLPTQWHDFTSGAGGQNRVHFSSHLNPAVWTASPGGYTDITDYAGTMTALGRGTRYLTIHFVDGVETGQLTGQDDEPLDFKPTRARIGAIGPRALIDLPEYRLLGGQIFIGTDLRLYRFTGDNVAPIDVGELAHFRVDPWSTFTGAATAQDVAEGWWRHNSNRHEVSFHYGTYELRINCDDGGISFHRYPMRINAGTEPVSEHGTLDRGNLAAYLGTDRKDSGGTDRDLIYELRDDRIADVTTGFTGSIGTVEAMGDALVFSGWDRLKVIAEILVFAKGTAAGVVAASATLYRDGVSEALSSLGTTTLSTTEERMWRFQPTEKSGQVYRVHLLPPNTGRLTRMIIFWADVGSARAQP